MAKTPEQQAARRAYLKAWRAKNADKDRAYSLKYRTANAELMRERTRAWRAANPEKVTAYARKYAAENADKVKALTRVSLPAFKGLGLRPVQRAELLQQLRLRCHNHCEICGTPDGRGKAKLCVDHCHKTGSIRGMLCGLCNSAIGYLGDSPERLEKAAEYLRRA